VVGKGYAKSDFKNKKIVGSRGGSKMPVVNDPLQMAAQMLTLLGAFTVLLVLFLLGLVVRTSFRAEEHLESQVLRHELNRQFLVFSLMVVTMVGLTMVGVAVPLALSAAMVLMLTSYRWLWQTIFMVGAGLVLIVLLQLLPF